MKILEFTSNESGASLKVEIVTLVFGVTHVLKLHTDKWGSLAVDSISGPEHPHISRRSICLDYTVRNQVRSLVGNQQYKEALLLVASALETINMRSAYPNRYQHIVECMSCRKWKEKDSMRKCSICNTLYCSDCAKQCSCGTPLSVCAKCKPQTETECLFCVLDKKISGVNILRINLDRTIEGLLLSNGIKTIAALENLINGNTKIRGIGPARLSSMEQAYRSYRDKVSSA